MGKEIPGKQSGHAAEIVRSRDIDKTPGKATAADDGVPPVYNILTPSERAEKVLDTKLRIVAAGARANDALEASKIHTLLKKPADMHWAFALLLDVAFSHVTLWAGKAIMKLKAGKIGQLGDASHDAVMGGDYGAANKAEARRSTLMSISDESIKNRVGIIGGLAKSQARPVVAAALADSTDKVQTLSYLVQLQRSMDVAFQNLGEKAVKGATDAELIVLHDAMDIAHHSSEVYTQLVSDKVKRYQTSGVDRIGKSQNMIEAGSKRDVVGFSDVDRRVVWVQHEDGTRSLWFHEKSESHTNAQARSLGGDGEFHLTGLVPREFWEEAVEVSEQRSGAKIRTLMDSPETRKARGVSPNYAQRINAAKIKSSTPAPGGPVRTDVPDGSADGIIRLFGGK